MEILKIKVSNKTHKATGKPIDEAVRYIKSKYSIKYNIFANEYTIHLRKGSQEQIDKSDLELRMKNDGVRIGLKDIEKILTSQSTRFKVSENFNPIHEYLNKIKKVKKAQISHIDLFSSFLNPKNMKKEIFQVYFKKWFVATIATILGKSTNDVVFVIAQEQGGTGKTKYIKHIFDIAELTIYINTISEKRTNVDLLKEMTRNILILFDEMAILKKNYIDSLKSIISQDEIKTNTKSQNILPRLGSFAGTTNHTEEKGGFIPKYDKGLMRRILTVENEGFIDYQTYIKEVSQEQMLAEALYLIESGYNYKFDYTDFKFLEQNNRKYLKGFDLKEIIEEFYQKPEGNFNKKEVFKTATEIFPSKISNVLIGKTLKSLEFQEYETRVGENKSATSGYLIKRKI